MLAGSYDFSVGMKVIFFVTFCIELPQKGMNFSILVETSDKRLIV